MSSCVILEMGRDRVCNGGLEVPGRETPAGRITAARDEPVGDIVAEPLSPAIGVGRGEEITSLVPDLPLERRGLLDGRTRLRATAPGTGRLQALLDPGPQIFFDDRGMRAWVGFLLVPDQAGIDRVGEIRWTCPWLMRLPP